MRVERIATKQIHPVPNKVHQPRGPFPPEVLAEPKIVWDYQRQPEDGGDDVPVEGTAQNNFKATKWFRCNDCSTLVSEAQLETHTCEE